AGVSVGGFKARIGPRGLVINDKRLGGPQLKALQGALNKALKQAGIRITPGRELLRRAKRKVSAEAYAFAVRVHKQVVPSQAPEARRRTHSPRGRRERLGPRSGRCRARSHSGSPAPSWWW